MAKEFNVTSLIICLRKVTRLESVSTKDKDKLVDIINGLKLYGQFFCPDCKGWFMANYEHIETKHLESDISRRDILKLKCPYCGRPIRILE